ncbi:N-acyl-D-amino-acid deacylase family protein [Phenylobacterium aquaticum]|uniref:N-acyl-D-amino-acid deacylase family protein n=1 Tax=Phenylobacterium aquaticum TaxID=1763816 RepID=UPI001F5CA5E9|nr:hypothetical protein [Phenylobacterium aquaticum]MCI3131184.1 hypothetical protein [Phenylobacterium aquaticum]
MRYSRRLIALIATTALATALPAHAADFDVLILGGRVYDGAGRPGRAADIGIRGDRITAIGRLRGRTATTRIDATGLAVAPGFINMLSQAGDDLLVDGRSQSDIRQGVTLEMIGEGLTAGPLNPAMKMLFKGRLARLGVRDADWSTEAEYLDLLQRRGVSPNVAAFVGATNARLYVVGADNRKATPDELAKMQDLVRQAMADGAFGVSSALGYAPAAFADKAELTALAAASAPWNGLYISHLRDEGEHLTDSVDELIAIARDAKVKGEIYHFKVAGLSGLPKLNQAIAALERPARPASGWARTCIPIRPRPRDWTSPCRSGFKPAVSRPGSTGCVIRRSGRGSLRRCATRPPGPAAGWLRSDRPTTSSSWP